MALIKLDQHHSSKKLLKLKRNDFGTKYYIIPTLWKFLHENSLAQRFIDFEIVTVSVVMKTDCPNQSGFITSEDSTDILYND